MHERSHLPCGRRGTACSRGWRTWWLVRVRCMLACALRCSVVPISQTRRLSPTASAVPPLSEKEGFCVHHPLPSFMSNSLRGCTFPSLLPCGRRGTALAVEDRELAGSLEYLACLRAHYVAVSYQLAGSAGYHPPLTRSPLFQRKRAFMCITHCLLS